MTIRRKLLEPTSIIAILRRLLERCCKMVSPDWRSSINSYLHVLSYSPFPHSIGNFPVQRMARLCQYDADLAAMIGFVRNKIADKGCSVGLEALNFALRRQAPFE